MSVRVEATCPRSDGIKERTSVEAVLPQSLPAEYRCTSCGDLHAVHREALSEAGGLRACLACSHPELYTQKDFPRGLGIAIVVLAAVLAPFTWYLSLAAAALADLALYHTARDIVVCYVCRSRHSRFPVPPRHPRFDREIEERLKYGARAVMGKPMRSGGTADAPEPEH